MSGKSVKTKKELYECIARLQNQLDDACVQPVCNAHCSGKCEHCPTKDACDAGEEQSVPQGCVLLERKRTAGLESELKAVRKRMEMIERRRDRLVKSHRANDMNHFETMVMELVHLYLLDIRESKLPDASLGFRDTVTGIKEYVKRCRPVEVKARSKKRMGSSCEVIHARVMCHDKYVEMKIFFEYAGSYYCFWAHDAHWIVARPPVLAIKRKKGGWRIMPSGVISCEVSWYGDPVIDVEIELEGVPVRIWSSGGIESVVIRFDHDDRTDVDVPFVRGSDSVVRWETTEDAAKKG